MIHPSGKESSMHCSLSRIITATKLPLIAALTLPLLPATLTAGTNTFKANAANGLKWSAGTGWDSKPVSSSGTTLIFRNESPLPDTPDTKRIGYGMSTINDLGNPFNLGALLMDVSGNMNTYTKVLITGQPLQFNSSGSNNPTITCLSKPGTHINYLLENEIRFRDNLEVYLTNSQLNLKGPLNGSGTITVKAIGSGVGVFNTNPMLRADWNVSGAGIGVIGDASLGSGTITLSRGSSFGIDRNREGRITHTINSTITGPSRENVQFRLALGNRDILAKQNSYGGTTSYSRYPSTNTGGACTLQLGIHDALPTNTALKIFQTETNSTTATTLDLYGFNQTIRSLESDTNYANTANTIITNGASSSSKLTINGTSNRRYDGLIAGNISLFKGGTGTQTLTGLNTYTGNTVIVEGAISIPRACIPQNTVLNISSKASIDLNRPFTNTVSSFQIDNIPQSPGVYGAVGSGAMHETPQITGSGFIKAGR
jgi:autotransporter-associated beta strand protein